VAASTSVATRFYTRTLHICLQREKHEKNRTKTETGGATTKELNPAAG
jgi:hypothetical protein